MPASEVITVASLYLVAWSTAGCWLVTSTTNDGAHVALVRDASRDCIDAQAEQRLCDISDSLSQLSRRCDRSPDAHAPVSQQHHLELELCLWLATHSANLEQCGSLGTLSQCLCHTCVFSSRASYLGHSTRFARDDNRINNTTKGRLGHACAYAAFQARHSGRYAWHCSSDAFVAENAGCSEGSAARGQDARHGDADQVCGCAERSCRCYASQGTQSISPRHVSSPC